MTYINSFIQDLKVLFTIALILLLPCAGMAETYTGVTLEGTSTLTGFPSYYWPMERNLLPSASSDTYIGTVTHAGTNRTRINENGLIEAVGANVARFEEVGGPPGGADRE